MNTRFVWQCVVGLATVATLWATAEANGPQSNATAERSPRELARDRWQRPNEVFDKLNVAIGSRVADIGSGEGYFTVLLAERVGTTGKVLAVDVSDSFLNRVRERVAKANLTQVELIKSERNDPKLPVESLDAVIIVNAYHEFKEYDAMMAGIVRGLRPGGRLAILDYGSALGHPRSAYSHEIPGELVIEDATRQGLRLKTFDSAFVTRETGARGYLAVFEKPIGVEPLHQH